MNRASLINIGLQVGFAVLRYAMMGWVYAHSDIESVGSINAMLTFVTSITFLAGFELHHVVNRSLLMGHGSELRWGPDRQVLALLTIGVMAWFADLLLAGSSRGAGFALLVFWVAVMEYLALEIGRLLIAKGRYLVVTVCGFIRSVAPFLVVIVASPTLEGMLCSWLMGTVMVLGTYAVVLRRAGNFRVKWQLIDLAGYRSAVHFFLAGVTMALIPSLERWLVGTFFSAAVLGQYALAMTLVSACDLVMQGGIWQIFVTRIMQRLSKSVLRLSTVGILLVTIVVVYLGASVFALLFSSHLLGWINKDPLPKIMLISVFLLGMAKALYTLLFYCLYATDRERVLPKIQVAMVAALVLGVAVGANAGFDAGKVIAAVGVVWIVLLLVLILRWTAEVS